MMIYFQIVDLLLSRPELELDPVNTHKHVPLHLAAQNGHLVLSRLLVEAGSDLNAADLQGENKNLWPIELSNLLLNLQIMFRCIRLTKFIKLPFVIL